MWCTVIRFNHCITGSSWDLGSYLTRYCSEFIRHVALCFKLAPRFLLVSPWLLCHGLGPSIEFTGRLESRSMPTV